MPDYLRTALDGLHTTVPAGWAYTLTTVRNDRSITERFEPAKPAATQWTLLDIEDRTPTADEMEKYQRARSSGPGGMQANFEKNDIDPGSLTLLREDDIRAEYSATFRETSTGSDKMLGHLILRLTVEKQVPHVAAYALELKEPYSPVLGVKMNELRVEVRFSAPAPDRPALPIEITSRFAGRIFFIPTGETLRLTYRDYRPPTDELSR
jgi:hypothetical protein